MKKIIALMMTLILTAALFAGCAQKPAETTEAPATEAPTEAADPAETLNKIHEDVKAVFGEEYIPSMAFTDEEMKNFLGIDPTWCEAYVAEGPMISAQVDMFVAVKAKPEHTQEVKDALLEYQRYLKEDSFQYPTNVPKVNASKVVDYGDYVFFTMLGMIPMEVEEQGDEAIAAKAEEFNQSVIDVIENVLGK